jgi:hypothetical protein
MSCSTNAKRSAGCSQSRITRSPVGEVDHGDLGAAIGPRGTLGRITAEDPDLVATHEQAVRGGGSDPDTAPATVYISLVPPVGDA